MKKNHLYFFLLEFLFLFEFVYTDDSEVNYIVELIKNGTYENVSPCQNFYYHVCFDWNRHSRNVNFFQEAREKLSSLENVVVESPRNEADSVELSMEKEWHAKCVDTRISNSDGYDLIKDIFDKADKLATWQEMNAYYAKKFGQNLLFDVHLNENNILSIERPRSMTMMLPKIDSNFNSNVIEKINLLDVYFRNGEDTIENDLVGGLVDILQKYIERVESVKGERASLTYTNFQEKYNYHSSYTKINWLEQLQSLGLNVEEHDQFLFDSEFLLSYHYIMLAERRSHLIIRGFIHFIYIMNDKFVSFWNPTQYALSASTISNICIKYMPIKNGIIQEIFYKRFAEKTTFFEKIFHSVKEAYLNEIENSWLTGEYKEWVLQQLSQTKMILPGIYSHTIKGYPYTYDFTITQCGLQNLINFNKAQIEYKVKKFHERRTRVKRDLHLNSAYDKIHNYINIVAEHILTPLFSLEAPVAWNYGHLGSVIGHELSHKIDNILSIRKPDAIKNEYRSRVECYIANVNKYVGGANSSVHVDGRITQKENIADSVGLKVAYNALKKLMKKKWQLKREKLPGLKDLTAKQLFFTAFATMYCERPSKPFEMHNTHPPNFVRVREAIKNFGKFAKAFHCSTNDSMVRENKCDLWSP